MQPQADVRGFLIEIAADEEDHRERISGRLEQRGFVRTPEECALDQWPLHVLYAAAEQLCISMPRWMRNISRETNAIDLLRVLFPDMNGPAGNVRLRACCPLMRSHRSSSKTSFWPYVKRMSGSPFARQRALRRFVDHLIVC